MVSVLKESRSRGKASVRLEWMEGLKNIAYFHVRKRQVESR
jgi:hypothetical protein